MSVHLNARQGEIAPVVLLAGDPLRAKYISEQFLQDARLVSTTRNAYYFTGTYRNKPVTVGASGMGCPSIGIYSFELYNEYQVSAIIRIGTAGAYSQACSLYDLINVNLAVSESTYAREAFGFTEEAFPHQGMAYEKINETAKRLAMPISCNPIHSSDVFYRSRKGTPPLAEKYNCPAVEMEAFALFANARHLNKMAATLLTISDIIPTGEQLSAEQRQSSLEKMAVLGLESAISI